MTVHGLQMLPGNDVYECWWLGPGSTKAHPQLVSGGTFVVDSSGSTTVTMTTGIDPRQFTTMEVTAEPPGTGALSGAVLPPASRCSRYQIVSTRPDRVTSSSRLTSGTPRASAVHD